MSDHQSNNLFPIEKLDDLIRPFIVQPERKISLTQDYDPSYKADHLKKSKAKGQLKEGIRPLAELKINPEQRKF